MTPRRRRGASPLSPPALAVLDPAAAALARRGAGLESFRMCFASAAVHYVGIIVSIVEVYPCRRNGGYWTACLSPLADFPHRCRVISHRVTLHACVCPVLLLMAASSFSSVARSAVGWSPSPESLHLAAPLIFRSSWRPRTCLSLWKGDGKSFSAIIFPRGICSFLLSQFTCNLTQRLICSCDFAEESSTGRYLCEFHLLSASGLLK